jgi:hypothetical protein
MSDELTKITSEHQHLINTLVIHNNIIYRFDSFMLDDDDDEIYYTLVNDKNKITYVSILVPIIFLFDTLQAYSKLSTDWNMNVIETNKVK